VAVTCRGEVAVDDALIHRIRSDPKWVPGWLSAPLGPIPAAEFRTFSAPGGTVSQENQAEWIFERPGVTGASPQLPNFGEIYFDSALGGYGLEFVADDGPDTVLNMVQNSVPVATTASQTPTLIKVAYTGG
jgi:hypothetical protein